MIAAFALDAHATKSVNANAIVRRAELIATFRTFEIDSSEYSASGVCVCSASGVCVFGVGCVYSAADGGACLSRARVRRTTDPTRANRRARPTDADRRPPSRGGARRPSIVLDARVAPCACDKTILCPTVHADVVLCTQTS